MIRLPLCILAIIASIVGAFIAYNIKYQADFIGFLTYDPILLAFGIWIPFFMMAGSNAINDLADYASDLKNNRQDRPLVTGEIQKSHAKIIASIGLTLGPILSLILERPFIFLAVSILSILSVSYSLWLKKIGLIGNIVVSFSQTTPFLLGALIFDLDTFNAVATISLMVITTFIGTLSREIAKGIMDQEGDREEGFQTIAVRYGVKIAAQVTITMQGITIFLLPLPYFFGLNNYIFLACCLLPIVLIIIVIYKLLKDQSYKTGVEVRKYSRFSLYGGVFAYFIGALF